MTADPFDPPTPAELRLAKELRRAWYAPWARAMAEEWDREEEEEENEQRMGHPCKYQTPLHRR